MLLRQSVILSTRHFWSFTAKQLCSISTLSIGSLIHQSLVDNHNNHQSLPELQDAVEEVLPSLLEEQVKVFILADRCRRADVQSFKDKMSQSSSDPISKDFKSHLTPQSPAVYIYTSGTTGKASSSGVKCWGFKHLVWTFGFSLTGLPKAAVVPHSKLWALAKFPSVAGLKSTDVMYDSLPLYHSAGFVGIISTIDRGTHTYVW